MMIFVWCGSFIKSQRFNLPKTNLFPLRHQYNHGRPRQPVEPWNRKVNVPLGSGQPRWYHERYLAWMAGCRKGGITTGTRPNPGRFTSETGKAAALKVWRTRWRKVKGVRIGRPRARRKS